VRRASTGRARIALPRSRLYGQRPEGRAAVLPNPSPMDLGQDTIAGSKLLSFRFGRAGDFQPEHAVMHGDRRARFIRISDGAAIIQHWGESQVVSVPPKSLSLPPVTERYPAPRPSAGAYSHQAWAPIKRPRLGVRAETGRLPRHHPQRRPELRP
jgi:hypothetical protein